MFVRLTLAYHLALGFPAMHAPSVRETGKALPAALSSQHNGLQISLPTTGYRFEWRSFFFFFGETAASPAIGKFAATDESLIIYSLRAEVRNTQVL